MEKVLTNVVTQIDFSTYWLLLNLMVVAVIILILKTWLQNVAEYLRFRMNIKVGIDTWVEVYGGIGQITKVSISTVTVTTADNYILVPMRLWKTSRFKVLSKCPGCRGRKKD